MATKKKTTRAAANAELQAAAELVLQQEEERQQRRRKRAIHRRRERKKSERLAVLKMQQSIEVIKWCIVAICTVWLVSFIIGIVILVKVNDRVAEIDGQVERIKHVLENPFSSAGARVGAEADKKWREFLGIEESVDRGQ